MSYPIDGATIADLFESIHGPFELGSMITRDRAADEVADELERLSGYSDVTWSIEQTLNQVPDVDKSKGKHTDECWKLHAPCLASKLQELLPS